MTYKDAKIILFASLIAMMAVPVSMANAQQAETITVEDDNKYDYLQEIIDRKNFEKKTVINDVEYKQKFKVKQVSADEYKVKNKFQVLAADGTKSKFEMVYTVTDGPDGLEVDVVDQPKIKVKRENVGFTSVSTAMQAPLITNIGYVSGSWPATIIAVDEGTVSNGFASGSDSYSQSCWGDTNTWSMTWQADTTWSGYSSNDWREVNWSVTGDSALPVYQEYCVFPFYTEKTTVIVSGTGYSDSQSHYANTAYLGGWSGNDIENPWDDITFKVEFKQKSIP